MLTNVLDMVVPVKNVDITTLTIYLHDTYTDVKIDTEYDQQIGMVYKINCHTDLTRVDMGEYYDGSSRLFWKQNQTGGSHLLAESSGQ